MSTTEARRSPTPFRERSLPVKCVLAGVIPAVLGAIAGVLLGVSAVAYAALGLLAAVGSFLAGFEHEDAWSGADRGLIAGAAYGVALLVAHGLAGTHAKVSLGSFPPFLVIVTAVVGALLTAAGATREDRPAGGGERQVS